MCLEDHLLIQGDYSLYITLLLSSNILFEHFKKSGIDICPSLIQTIQIYKTFRRRIGTKLAGEEKRNSRKEHTANFCHVVTLNPTTIEALLDQNFGLSFRRFAIFSPYLNLLNLQRPKTLTLMKFGVKVVRL